MVTELCMEMSRKVQKFWLEWGHVFTTALQQNYANELWQEYVDG